MSRTTRSLLRQCPQLARSFPRPSQGRSTVRLYNPAKNPPNRTLCRRTLPVKSAVDPTTFLAVAGVSAVIAYCITAYTRSPTQTPPLASENSPSEPTATGPFAPDSILDMAPTTPPGRPGNLTADQEAKLKEMWLATLDIFGVTHHERPSTPPNGSQTPHPTSSIEGPESSAKKKKSRLTLFGKKGKHDADKTSAGDSPSSTTTSTPDASAGAGDNDKHGQTKEFQHALASQSPEALREAFWSMCKHDHPDALLLRFLRARKWDVQAALVMLVATMHWRSEEMHVDDHIMYSGEGGAVKEARDGKDATAKKEGEDFLAQLRMGKSFLHGSDKEGRPCCYVRVKLHRQGEQSERSLEQFTVYTIETARMLLRPPVDTATIVFDMTDFSMANMDYTPVKFMIKCFEANYPESLGSVLVYKAPWLFNQIWKIIRGWLDPVVAGKVHFANSVDDLAAFIPKSQILKELGGGEDWEYQYVEPTEGENRAMDDVGQREKVLAERAELVGAYEGQTLAWAKGEGEDRSKVAERLAANYWRLDPYVRARSLYDRQGVLAGEGKLDFYPGKKETAAAAGRDDELD